MPHSPFECLKIDDWNATRPPARRGIRNARRNQIEAHPYFQQIALQRVHAKIGIAARAWPPIGGITSYRSAERIAFDSVIQIFVSTKTATALRHGARSCRKHRCGFPHMKQQRAGHIINVSSVAGHNRQEVKPYNIRTTVISPGAVIPGTASPVHFGATT